MLTCTTGTIFNAKHSESDNCFVYKHLKFNTVLIMGLIREANHEVNGSLTTYNIEDHSGGLLEIKWCHDVKFSNKKRIFFFENLYFRILVNH